MKEAFDKIIERLEEQQEEYIEDYNRYGDGEDYRISLIYDRAIRIVNQVAEEFGSKDCSKCSRRSWYQIGYADAEKKCGNDGWITLPKEAFDRMIARMESESERDLEEEPSWFINVKDAARIVFEIVREYQPKGEQQ